MIEIESLTKQYGPTVVVDAVSMSIVRGSIAVVVGTSGSGKSTLLRMINQLVLPTRGRVLIDGRDTATTPSHLLRRQIGYAIQGNGLFPHRTVAENIGTVPALLGWDAERIKARVAELLQIFQLEPAEYAGKFPHQLWAASSSGWAWRGRWRRSPRCCSWMSRSGPSIPSSARRRKRI